MLINTGEKMQRRRNELINDKANYYRSMWNKTKKEMYKILLQELTGEGDFMQADYGEEPKRNNHE